MNLHQFRFVREAVRQNFNLTEAAKALYTSQPGVSKAIIELEDELGVEIFTRHGKRVRSLTEPGRIILASVERILQEVESLKRVGKDYAAQDQGNLTIAATHTQARYSLPAAIAEFKKRFPKVHLSILQGSPTQVAEMVIHDQADLAIATEAIADYKELVSLPCFQWHHTAVVRPITRSSSASRCRSTISRSFRSSRTTTRSRAARRSTRRSRCIASRPTSCSRRSTRT